MVNESKIIVLVFFFFITVFIFLKISTACHLGGTYWYLCEYAPGYKCKYHIPTSGEFKWDLGGCAMGYKNLVFKFECPCRLVEGWVPFPSYDGQPCQRASGWFCNIKVKEGVWDASESKCVVCYGPREEEWFDCGGDYIGNYKCESACGADPKCDEKNKRESCGNNGICDDVCECCEPYDSDNGINYFEKGTTRGLYILGGYILVCSKFKDYCLNGTHLVEYYLDGNYIKNKTVNCKSLGNYGCFDGACVGISLTLSKYIAPPNEQITATIKINGFRSSMQGEYVWVLKADVSTIDRCISNCREYGRDVVYCFYPCLKAYWVCSCTINSTGSCSCNFNAPSNPGTYNYTAFVDLNGNYEFDEGEYDTKSLTVASVSLTLSKYQALPSEQITATIEINGFTSSMQGKTAYVVNISSDEIKNCLSSPNGNIYSCILPYYKCECAINSTGSCSCNFNAPSNPGTYNYTAFVDLNGNYEFDEGEYDTKSLTVASVSLTLSKYQALPSEQITATIEINGFTSSMQGKTAYVVNISSDEIKNCLSSPNGNIYSCILPYYKCECAINSTGSCSCNFNAPSNPGTYNYTAFVDLNGNYEFDEGEYDTESLTVSLLCYKTCNTHNDCKGDFEKTCCQNGLATYCNPRTKTCECFTYCKANDECQEGYCCLFSISVELPKECVPSWNITNYQGKSYLCDPIIWKNEENLKNENNKNLIKIIIEKIRSLLQPLSTFISHFK